MDPFVTVRAISMELFAGARDDHHLTPLRGFVISPKTNVPDDASRLPPSSRVVPDVQASRPDGPHRLIAAVAIRATPNNSSRLMGTPLPLTARESLGVKT